MPFVHVWDNNVAGVADLYANSGLYAAGQANDHAALAQQQQQASQLGLILNDQRQREHNAQMAAVALAGQAGRQTIADQNNQTRLTTNQNTVTGANDRATAGNVVRTDIANANRDSHEGIAEANRTLGYTRDETAQRGQDIASGDRAAQMAQQQALAQQRQEHQDAVLKATTAARLALQDQRLDVQTRNRIVQAAVQELSRRRNNVHQELMANPSDDGGWHVNNYAQLTQEIQRLNNSMGQRPAPQQQPAPAPAPQAQQGPAQVMSEADYLAIPPGTQYVAPDGTVRIKQP